MKVSDADRELARELAESFDLALQPWQERLLAIILSSHRQKDADRPSVTLTNHPEVDTAIPTCRRWSLSTGEFCVLREGHSYDGVNFFHQTSRGRPFMLCDERGPDITGRLRCSLEPHAAHIKHSAGAQEWTD